LAKRLEEIISYKDGEFKVVDLPDDRQAINVLKRGRDEAHRFAISYFRRLHQRRLYE
jgi:excinuclease ABC subunit C